MNNGNPAAAAREPVPSTEALASARVLIVGDAMLDRYWFGAVDRISPEAPVPVVKISREEERMGGAANVALNVKSLGAQATLMTVVGEDEPGERLHHLLTSEGISTHLGRDSSCHTIVKLRVIGRSQQLLRVDFENQPDHEVLAAMLATFESIIGEHDVVLFSDYGKGGLTHIPRMIELAREAGKPVLVDPKGSDFSRYAGATIITPNRAELEQVVGKWTSEKDLFERAHALRKKLRLAGLVLTRSEEGMSLFDKTGNQSGHMHVPAMAREVFDVTGAGDTVIATLAVMLACSLSLRQAVPIANRAGAIVVGKFGTATATREELSA